MGHATDGATATLSLSGQSVLRESRIIDGLGHAATFTRSLVGHTRPGMPPTPNQIKRLIDPAPTGGAMAAESTTPLRLGLTERHDQGSVRTIRARGIPRSHRVPVTWT